MVVNFESYIVKSLECQGKEHSFPSAGQESLTNITKPYSVGLHRAKIQLQEIKSVLLKLKGS